ncbi:MAG: hypothetical protein KAT11_03290 [Phycisphaerae bacterium]|nr:hypothetical protein [Phycisphaerae bacterium]
MKGIVGQPADYSEILQRIFCATFASGIVCTFILAKASPSVQEVIDSISIKANIGFINDMKILYVIIPLIIGIVSCMLKLHDRISDLFRIRFHFDTKFILFPLAKGTEVILTKDLKEKIGQKRVDAMYAVFYEYASFKKPVIDEQLVRTAADNWGWLWVLVESSFLFGVTAIILGCLRRGNYVLVCLVVILVEMVLMLLLWFACKKSAKRQLTAILADSNRKSNIAGYFQSLGLPNKTS